MIIVKRNSTNPILGPDVKNDWEATAAFNGSPVRDKIFYYLVYRAISEERDVAGAKMQLSTVGFAKSRDGIHFTDRRRLIVPDYDWEKYGCEDPRITKIGGKFYIFYTALSSYPFGPDGIKIGVAVTTDFSKFEKHPVTPFNSKAMALFPDKINGKLTAILTVNTDKPPVSIAVAQFDREEDIWSPAYWNDWYSNLNSHAVPLLRSSQDHMEVGAAPLKTRSGWLLFYSYIYNYRSGDKVFAIEAALLDLKDPTKVIGRTLSPLLTPQRDYELNGNVPNVIFPTGAILDWLKTTIFLYYGAADTTLCLATLSLPEILGELEFQAGLTHTTRIVTTLRAKRYEKNPLIIPRPDNPWEARATFNPAAIYEDGRVHLVYRAMGQHADPSVLGYAASSDGFDITERLVDPIYTPRSDFERAGCEDPRLTRLGDKIYMCYTAYDAQNPTRVALTDISVDDFLAKKWNWEKPKLISPPGIDDKNSCLFPERVSEHYVFLHRISPCIWIDFRESLDFSDNHWLKGSILLSPRTNNWDSEKIGIAAPPFRTKKGWLLLYHGLSKDDRRYRVGAVLLDTNHPERVLARLGEPLLEPQASYENEGQRPGTVFVCGAVIIGNDLIIYYGAGDTYCCAASVKLSRLLSALRP